MTGRAAAAMSCIETVGVLGLIMTPALLAGQSA
jgi:hypothetical protein